jgi:hypothetical protein
MICGRTATLPLVLSLLLAPSVAAIVAGPAAAAVIPGQIDRVELASSLRNQGLGGPFVLTATLFVGSDPHRTLFVEGLNLTLSFDAGLSIVSGENPRRVDALAVPPSADFYAVPFAWTFNSTHVGDYTVNLTVSSTSGGGASAAVNVSIRLGPVLGKLILSPASPTTTTPLNFSVAASSGFEAAEVHVNVTLFVYQSPTSVKPESATNGTLRLANADRSWTFVKGTPLRMDPEGGDAFGYTTPPLGRGALIYWAYAEARLDNGTVLNSTTSQPTSVFIQDPGITAAVFWGATASVTAVLAGALYVMFYDPFGRKPAVGALHNSPDRVRAGVVILLVGLAVFSAAFALGAATGLWRWFGYLA